ncbi:glycine--tRNA ligase subunit beta [candidate division WOR-3 bacterium]|nr:glycine--tRNA ligase subunit beta [candidate division WOR-3 bacterium]
MNKDLLLELYFEDFPASYLRFFSDEFKTKTECFLKKNNLAFSEISVMYTPRRLALIVRELAVKKPDSEILIKGPSVAVAFEKQLDCHEKTLKNGKPTKALEGFLKKNGAKATELFVDSGEKGIFLFLKKFQEGEKTESILSSWLPEALRTIKFPKTMKWEASGFRFPRPLRNILFIFGEDLIPVEIAGVKSAKTTVISHTRRDDFAKVNPRDYKEALREKKIIADHEERKKTLIELLENKSMQLGGKLIRDEDLIEEVADLVEYPVLVEGRLPEEYMTLPSEIIITALKSHQRDFSIAGKDGSLMLYFLYVADGISERACENAVKGNETIVGSRLEDAYFYFADDTKKPFTSFSEKLSEMTYMRGLGTLQQKTERLKELVLLIKDFCRSEIDIEALKRASELCKCDMATAMIRDGKEFTSLQGVIGSYYALKSGESEKTAEIIRNHLLEISDPVFSDESQILGMADKMDHLCGFISILGIPKGSADPYGLRKSANLIIQISLDRSWHIDFEGLLKRNLGLYANQGLAENTEDTFKKVCEYFSSRIERALRDRGIRYDIADAAIAVSGNDPLKAFEISSALSEYREQKNFIDLVIASKRTERILEDFNFKASVDEGIFESDYERELLHSFKKIKPEVEKFLGVKNYTSAMDRLLDLKKPIDNFFDNVMVNVEDESKMINRKALLSDISNFFKRIADLSKIVIEGEERDRTS